MILSSGTLILVADGARMLLLRNTGDAASPNLEVIEHRQHQSLSNRELASDSPGVSFSSSGRERHTDDEGDPHNSEEARFLRSAAETLEKVIGKEAKSVIVAAAPPALGILRSAYSDQVLKADLDKDFTQLPVTEIARHLAAL